MLQAEEINVFFEVSITLRFVSFVGLEGGEIAVAPITKRLKANNLLLEVFWCSAWAGNLLSCFMPT
jgi:hypothetical protein